jgi:micrococcal nuclease
MKKYIFIALFLLQSIPAHAQTYTVERVMDSATLELSGGESVRLIGVGVPGSELNGKADQNSERAGQKATEFVKNIVGDWKQVKVKFDLDAQEKDREGRLLAYVYLYQCAPGCMIDADVGYAYYELDDGVYLFLNETIIAAGYGVPTASTPNVKHADLFAKAYKNAKERKWGLWAEPSNRLKGMLNPNGPDRPEENTESLMEYFDRGMVNIKTSF